MDIDTVELASENITKHALSAEMRKNLFQFLAGMVNNRPKKDLIRSLIEGRENVLRDICAIGDSHEEFFIAIQEMIAFLDDASSQPIEDLETMLSVDWTRLFRGVQRGYGPPPPFESLYCENGQTGIEVMQAVNRRYWEAGFEMGINQPNRPDYLGVELEFLFILAEQEHAAWEKGDYATAQIKFQTAELFLIEHLANWVTSFCELAQKEAKTLFYHGLLRMIKSSVDSNTQESDLKPVLRAE